MCSRNTQQRATFARWSVYHATPWPRQRCFGAQAGRFGFDSNTSRAVLVGRIKGQVGRTDRRQLPRELECPVWIECLDSRNRLVSMLAVVDNVKLVRAKLVAITSPPGSDSAPGRFLRTRRRLWSALILPSSAGASGGVSTGNDASSNSNEWVRWLNRTFVPLFLHWGRLQVSVDGLGMLMRSVQRKTGLS